MHVLVCSSRAMAATASSARPLSAKSSTRTQLLAYTATSTVECGVCEGPLVCLDSGLRTNALQRRCRWRHKLPFNDPERSVEHIRSSHILHGTQRVGAHMQCCHEGRDTPQADAIVCQPQLIMLQILDHLGHGCHG